MRAVPDDRKFVIAEQNSYPVDLVSPNPRGWCHTVANSISCRNVWDHHSVWVAPQWSRLRDGRLVIIADYANDEFRDAN